MTPWERHQRRWRDCTACPLCHGRKQVVLARGTLPADVCFLGEAPGHSENVLGRPFVGPAGYLLNDIIKAAFTDLPPLATAFSNLVSCLPLGEDGKKNSEPEAAEIKACSRRLQEFVTIAQPRLVVAVGKLAADWLAKDLVVFPRRCKVIDIIHPAAILRASPAARGLLAQRAIVTLRNAVEELVGCSVSDG